MKTAVLSFSILLFSAGTQAQQVPVPRPITTVLQFPIESDQWPNSPLMKNKPVDPMATAVVPPQAVPDTIQAPPLPLAPPVPLLITKDTTILDNSIADLRIGVSAYDSAKSDLGVVVLDQITKSIIVDSKGKILEELPFGLLKICADGTMLGATDSELVKFNGNLEIVWKQPLVGIHHAITTDDTGNIYFLTSRFHDFLGMKVRFDVLEMYSPNIKLICRWDLFDHLKEFVPLISKSEWLKDLPLLYDSLMSIEEYVAQAPSRFFAPYAVKGDTSCLFEFAHFNSIQVLPANEISKKISAFKKGNLLLSFNPYSSYGILNPASGKIEWCGYLTERATLHTPSLTAKGTIVIFENSTRGSLWDYNEGCERCIHFLLQQFNRDALAKRPPAKLQTTIDEYDPITNKKIWEHVISPVQTDQTFYLGSVQKLPNGNNLVCASDSKSGGHVFEVTAQHEIVWNYRPSIIDPENGLPLASYRATKINLDLAKKLILGFKP